MTCRAAYLRGETSSSNLLAVSLAVVGRDVQAWPEFNPRSRRRHPLKKA
jgi:hypothetical protein